MECLVEPVTVLMREMVVCVVWPVTVSFPGSSPVPYGGRSGAAEEIHKTEGDVCYEAGSSPQQPLHPPGVCCLCS